MDEARIKSTREPVTGEDLWYMEVVDHDDFECLECALPVIPCSYDKDVNVRRPYFKVHKGVSHADGCQFDDNMEALRRLGKERSIFGEDGFPFPYPSRFTYGTQEQVVREEASQESGVAKSHQRRKSSNGSGAKRKPHHYSTNSFRAVANHFMNFPHDRHLPFSARGIEGKTYQECFRLLWQPKGAQTYREQEKAKIYYSPASWKKLEIAGDIIRIELNRGRWVEENGKRKPDRRFYIEIDTRDWPELTRKAFIHEFNKALDQTRGNKTKELFVFFVGSQDLVNDRYRFFVNDYRLIALKIEIKNTHDDE